MSRLRIEPLEDRRMLSVLLVDADAAPGGDGLAWATAYDDLQPALARSAVLAADADPANDVDQIWIAEGTYRPSALLEPGDARSASFSLVNGVSLYSGFAGTEATLDQRDWVAHVTTLSGDLGVQGETADNAYTVVYCGRGVVSGIDGLEITGGMADGTWSSGHPERRYGGGIYVGGTLTLASSRLSGNSAEWGGGIYNAGTLTVTGATFSDNSAVGTTYGSGGGIYSTGTATVTDSLFSTNLATGDTGGSGGGIYSTGIVTVTDCLFSANSATGDIGGSGGGIRSSGTLTVTGSTLSGNRATGENSGGGGAIYSYGTLTVSRSTLSDNSALGHDSYGGGILCRGSDVDDTLTVIDCTISRNSAENGGGFCGDGAYTSNTITITNSTFSTNSATYGGGAIYSRGILSLIDSTLFDNTAYTGGGVGNEGDQATLTITGSTLSNNAAMGAAGAIWNHNGDVTITDSTFSGNSARSAGAVSSNGTVSVTNSTFSGNRATGTDTYSGSAGAIGNSGTLTVTNCTLWGNSAVTSGGAIGVTDYSSTTSLYNTIVAGNTAPSGPDISRTLGTLSGSHNLIGDGSGQASLIDGDAGNKVGAPENPIDPFLGPLADNGGATLTHELLPGSPAIDAGSDALTLDSLGRPLATDQRGSLRRIGTVDIGAVERWPAGLPVAYDDLFGMEQGGSLILETSDITANDSCNEIGALAVKVIEGPKHGALTVHPDGTLTYTPEAGFWGNDAFSYRAVNGSLQSNAARVHLSVVSPESVVVTTTDDERDGDLSAGDVSLREALVDLAATRIQFSASLAGGIVRLTADTLAASGVHIVGLGSRFLAVDGTGACTVFTTNGTTAISHLTITGGSGTRGGGIYNTGTLTVTDCTLWENSTNSYGGGVYNTGTLTVVNTTISGNSAPSCGGVFNGGTLSATNSTFWGNKATGSDSSGLGGAIGSVGTLTLTNCTVWGNSATVSGGGIYIASSSSSSVVTTLHNNVVAGNAASSEPDVRLYRSSSSMLAGSHNLIGDGSSPASLVGAGNLIGTSANPIDPLLAPVMDAGGILVQCAPLPGSPAIDAGSTWLAVDAQGRSLATDQFGSPRCVGSVDMGAVEYWSLF